MKFLFFQVLHVIYFITPFSSLEEKILEKKPTNPVFLIDAIKMFVGQLPKHWNETEAREIFTEFGEVHTLNILRDRESNVSRGCCFVTFYTKQAALDAKNSLHNTKVLPGVSIINFLFGISFYFLINEIPKSYLLS